MADFSDVVSEIKKTNKAIDKLTKSTDPKGAAAAEDNRDVEIEEKKKTSLLRRIAEGVERGKKAGKDKDKKKEGYTLGKGLMASIAGGLAAGGIGGILGTMMAGLGIGALVGAGVYSAFKLFKSGLAGMDWAKEMGMESGTGFIAGFLGGGKKGGWMNAAFQGMKGMAAGATAGMAFGPVGMVVGALIGGALFGLAGFFGAEKIAKIVDPMVVKVKTFLGLSTTLTSEEKKAAEKTAKDLNALVKTRREESKVITAKLEAAYAAGADQKTIDSLIIQKSKADQLLLETMIKRKSADERVLENERVAEKNAVNVAEAAVRKNNFEVSQLKQRERRLKSDITMHGKDTLEGQLAAIKLAQIRVELRKKVKEGRELRQAEVDAEAVLLAEDRKLVKEAADKNISAPLRARLNVWTTDVTDMIGKKWNNLENMFRNFANWIYTPGSAGDDTGVGSSAKLFGFELKMPKLGLQEKWDTLKFSLTSWFKKNIFDPGGDGVPMRIFGVELKFPSIDISLPTKEELVAMLPEWMRDIKLPEFPELEFPKFEDLTMPDFKLKENFNKFTASIPQWIKNNIFDPGSAGDDTGVGTPMKIFGMELKFPKLNISFSGMAEKIKALLPEWLTDPAGYIKGLVADMAKLLPGMGGDDKVSEMSKEDIAKEIENVKANMEAMKTRNEIAQGRLDKTGRGAISKKSSAGKGERDRIEASMVKRTADLAEQQKRLAELEAAPQRQMGGPVTKGEMYNTHFKDGEVFIPDSSGMILSAQRTEQILQAGLQRGAAGAGGGSPTIVSAPVTSINNSSSNMTNTTTSFNHPSAILNRVNVAA